LTDGDFEDNPTTAWTTFGNAFLDGEVIGDLDQAAGFSGAESAKTFGNFQDGPFSITEGNQCGESFTFTFFFEDACGNVGNIDAVTNIVDTSIFVDNTPPNIITPPESILIDCNGDIINALSNWYNSFGSLAAEDENGVIKLQATKSLSLTRQEFNNSNSMINCSSGIVEVGFFALDTLDNSSDTIFANFEVQDITGPDISIEPSDLSIRCNVGQQDSLTNWLKSFGGALAIDDCSGNDVIWNKFTYLGSDGIAGEGTIENGPFNFINTDSCLWSAEVVFSVIDACGNESTTRATFSIEDLNAPVFTFVLRDTSLNCDNVPSASILIAEDECEGQIMSSVSDSSTQSNNSQVCEFFNYQIFRTYEASDKCGNITSFVQTITVSDTLEPRYTSPNDIIISCLENTNPETTGNPINIRDNCASEVIITFSDTRIGEGCEFEILRTWDIQDICGSSLILPQRILVKDSISPIITVQASNLILDCESRQDFDQLYMDWIDDFGGARAVDECGTPIISFAATSGSYDINNPSTFPGEINRDLSTSTCPSGIDGAFRSQKIDFVFVDGCNNASVSSAEFRILDDDPPVIVTDPIDTLITISDGSCSTQVSIPAPRILETCGSSNSLSIFTQSYEVSSIELGNEQIPIDPVFVKFGPLSFENVELLNNIEFDISLVNIDANNAGEYFNILDENGTDLGRTPLTSTQCGDTTFSISFSKEQIEIWLLDSFVEIQFLPNIPEGSGALAIN
ncbi:MAG: hypothetical protein AAF391_10940, partial [Bacteroidota bacterium]